jgi:hypothetical protein
MGTISIRASNGCHPKAGLPSVGTAPVEPPRARQLRPLSSQGTFGGAQSWMSLVATTLGLDDFGQLRVVVRATVRQLEGCRLVVQCYSAEAQLIGGLPGPYERPIAAAQRAVTSEQLRGGAELVLLQSGCRRVRLEDCRVVAWVEPGEPDLEYDGLRARPAGAVYVGSCVASIHGAHVELGTAA